jgi:CheY-like chemotaxis protein
MLKILVVEDEVDIQQLIDAFLSSVAVCDFANNGLEGIKLIKAARQSTTPYDLVMMDILMPHMDGGTALQHLRAMEAADGLTRVQGAKVIILTALDRNLRMVQPFKAQADGYLVKPFDQTELLKEIKHLGL